MHILQENAPRFHAMRVCFALCQRGCVIFMILHHRVKFSSSLRCFARLLAVGPFVKKNVVWQNVSENLLVKFLHSSFTPKKVFVHWQGTSFLFWLSIVLSRMKVKPIVRLVTLITSKPALFRFLVHVLVCSQSLRLTTAQVFLHFLHSFIH